MRRFTLTSMFTLAALGLALSIPMSAQAQDLFPGTPLPTFAPPATSYAPVPEYVAPVVIPQTLVQPVIVNRPIYRPAYRSAYRSPVRAYRGGFVRRGYRRW
jgi:hypothetical protein